MANKHITAIAGIFSSFVRRIRHNSNKKSNYIFYKIVDSFADEHVYKLQCINTKAIFKANITEIVFDTDILQGLHPLQACYIGIEYSKSLKKPGRFGKQKKQKEKIDNSSVCRYGKYKLCFQSREGTICFIDRINTDEFIMDPRDIALSEELISEFDAVQAFHIGLQAGILINNTTKKSKSNHQKPILRVIK